MVVVEAVKVVGEPDRIGRDRVRRAALRRLGDDSRELEDPLDEIALLGRQLAGRRQSVVVAGGCAGALRRIPAMRACAYWT